VLRYRPRYAAARAAGASLKCASRDGSDGLAPKQRRKASSAVVNVVLGHKGLVLGSVAGKILLSPRLRASPVFTGQAELIGTALLARLAGTFALSQHAPTTACKSAHLCRSRTRPRNSQELWRFMKMIGRRTTKALRARRSDTDDACA
jgi:hypothetical protein